jgi:hypothetical protein
MILEFGFWGRSERDEKRVSTCALGVPVELRYLTASIDEVWRRPEASSREGGLGPPPRS